MPTRGGRSGGSRGGRSGGTRAPRSSGGSSGSRGFRINLGNRSTPSTPTPGFSGTSGAGADPQNTNPTPNRRNWMRPGFSNPLGNIWRTIGIILAVVVLGICACVAFSLIVQQFGLGS